MYGQGNAHGSMPMAMPHIMSYGVVPGASPYGNVGGNEPSSSSFGGGSLSKVDNEAIKSMTAEEAAGVGTVMARGERPEAEKRHLRKAAGQIWNDATLEEWPDNDHRIFVGDLGNEVTDDLLANAFRKYPSYQKSKVIRCKKSSKSKGYGFVSLSDPKDMLKAIREMDRTYVGNRPIRVTRSKWQEREIGSEHNKRFQASLGISEENSKTQKKFKKFKPVTGGMRKSRVLPQPIARRNVYRGPHGHRFGNVHLNSTQSRHNQNAASGSRIF
eukprot:GHVU01104414.1.p1 GENE.GHVU01104414.1~~GHVU01104414.1.p1  ORF type:complete len:271 (-),score=28.42 GHVU01104414.1:672-1484(-)